MSKRVLVIDDDPDVLATTKVMLGADGYDVLTADGGEEGVAKALADSPDLILLDVLMPRMNGMEVFKKLREEPKTTGIPVIFLTAVGEETFVKSALMLGAEQYITKPYDPEDLLVEVRKTLGEKSV